MSINKNVAGAWNDTHFYVWPEERNDDSQSTYSIIYFVALESGAVTALQYNFEGFIRRLIIGPNQNHLYIPTDKIIECVVKYKDYFVDGNLKLVGPEEYYIKNYRFLRFPLNTPETLFFLASRALPRPLTFTVHYVLTNVTNQVIPIL